MKPSHFKRPIILALLLSALLMTGTTAFAAAPATLRLQAPEQARLGEDTTIVAVLVDSSGRPVQGATVSLRSSGSFLGSGGPISLGETVTNAEGKAVFPYQARTEGSVSFDAAFAGNTRYDAALASATLLVQGSAQLYTETAGIHVPGISVWLLVAVLGGVWSTYLSVMVILTLIARGEPEPAPASRGRHG